MMSAYLALQHRERLGRMAEFVRMSSIATQGDSKAIKKLLRSLDEEAK